MLPTIMNRGPIDPWTRTPRSIAPFSASAPSHHSLSSADFITNIAESNFRYTQVMKAAEDGCRYDAAHVLDGATDRSVFVERPMSPQLIIIGGVLRQNPAEVRFA